RACPESPTIAAMKALLEASPVLDISGVHVPISVHINPRARRLIVRVSRDSGEIVVVAPSKREVKEALAFAERQKGWIAARLREQPQKVAFVPGANVPLQGRMLAVTHRPNERGGVWIEGGSLCVSGESAHVPRRVEEFLKRHARARLTE